MPIPSITFKCAAPVFAVAMLASALSLSAQEDSIINYQFEDANGAYLGGAFGTQVVDSGAGGTWDAGVGRVNDGSLTYGYLANWRFETASGSGRNYVDQGSGPTGGFRGYTLNSALTASSHTTYALEVVIPRYDIRRNWDPGAPSASGKGVQFELRNADGSETVMLGFQTSGGGGVQAFANSTSGTFATLNGSAFGTERTPVRFANSSANNPGISLRISGDLSTGNWAAFAKDTNNDDYVEVQGGSGFHSIGFFRIAARSPAENSWGGGTVWDATPPVNGDFFRFDAITLDATPVPEVSTFALFAGILALAYVAKRRRLA